MVKQNAIKVFEEKKVRTVWDSDKEEWYFSIVDVVAVLSALAALFLISRQSALFFSTLFTFTFRGQR